MKLKLEQETEEERIQRLSDEQEERIKKDMEELVSSARMSKGKQDAEEARSI